MAFVFGKKIKNVKGILIDNCKIGFKNCPLHKFECDEGCRNCRAYESKFWDGENVHPAMMTLAEVCYLRQSGDKCPNGFMEFINGDVCKHCVHYTKEILQVNNIKEEEKCPIQT